MPSLGQWFRGRIYERRCDLSPDGKHFLYFAMNGKWAGPVEGSWTAISRTPYLKALALWPWGDCWNGGGLFLSDTTYWRNTQFWKTIGGEKDREIIGKLSRDLTEDPTFPFEENYGGECPGVYYIRLQRDGWKLLRRAPRSPIAWRSFTRPPLSNRVAKLYATPHAQREIHQAPGMGMGGSRRHTPRLGEPGPALRGSAR